MNKYKYFIQIVDFIFEVLIVLIISLVWCRYFIDDKTLSIACAFFFTLVLCFLFAYKKKQKQIKQQTLIISRKKMDEFKNYLLFSNPKKLLEQVQKVLTIKGVIADDVLLDKNHLFFAKLQEKPITKDVIITLLQKLDLTNIATITVLGISFDMECINFLHNVYNVSFEIEQIDEISSKYYAKELESEDFLSNPKICFKQNAVITLKTFLFLLLRPQNTKGYFFSAIILLFASIIVPQKIYYYICASVLLFLALLSKILNKKGVK